MNQGRSPGLARARIVHVSDLHLEPEGMEQYPGLFGRLRRLREVVAGLEPDLVVATGDLTNRGSSTPADFSLAAEWLDALGAPWIAVPGNHDLGANPQRAVESPVMEAYEGLPFAQTGFASTFGPAVVPEARAGDLTVLGVVLREDDPDDALGLLERAIVGTPGPLVVAGHYPVVETRSLSVDEPFGARGYIDRTAVRLERLLSSHSKVIAYLCGHVHLTSRTPIGTTCMQFTAGGLGPGAASIRSYEWDNGLWTYSTLDVEGPATFWENGLEDARNDPLFSAGSALERAGSWSPPITTTTKDPT